MTSSDSDGHESAPDDATSRLPEGTPPAIGSPDPEHLAAFTDRTFLCHHCGADGAEGRDIDSVVGPVRYRLGAGALLLPYCPACDLDQQQQRRAAAGAGPGGAGRHPGMGRPGPAGGVPVLPPGLRPALAPPRWATALPGGRRPPPVDAPPTLAPLPVVHRRGSRATTADHDRCRRTVDDLARWEREFYRKEPW